MAVIVIDGPEKAGKSTLAAKLQTLGCKVRHWGPVPEHYVYASPLVADCASEDIWIWDRGWASEHVYGILLARDRVLARDPWYGEWIFSRGVLTNGVLAMQLGPGAATLKKRRDSDDLPVGPWAERAAFEAYAYTYGWDVFEGNPDDQLAQFLYNKVVDKMEGAGTMHLPVYAGPAFAPVVFVGEARNPGDPWDGQFPFGSPMTTMYGRILGMNANKCGWTNTDADPAWLRRRPVVVACGQRAAQWCARNNIRHRLVPHPSWLYRFRRHGALRVEVEAELKAIVAKGLGLK